MSVEVSEITEKLNLVRTARFLRERTYIETLPSFPSSEEEKVELLKNLLFTFLKKKYVGCKIRPNANSLSLRLDGAIHRKANKLRLIWEREREWREWFERHHRTLARTVRDNARSHRSSSYTQVREVGDKKFVYVPYRPNRIYNYSYSGIIDIVSHLEMEYQMDERLAGSYDEFIRLMETEIERRETERREKIERELNEYLTGLKARLYRTATEMQEGDVIERLAAQKMIEWSRENGRAPMFAKAPTADNIVGAGTKVKIMSQVGSEEKNWFAVPIFEGYEVPEGYEMQAGWGSVTRIDHTHERSRNGEAPVVVEQHLFLSYNFEQWKHLMPEGYFELLEVSQKFLAEAEEQAGPILEQQRIEHEARMAEEARLEEQRAREAQELERRAEERAREESERMRQQLEVERARQREREQRDNEERLRVEREEAQMVEQEQRAAREAEERRQRLIEQLRQQVTQTDVPYVPAQVIPTEEATTATSPGIYRNSRAIPLERYVGVSDQGETRRFGNINAAAAWFEFEEGEITIHDFHAPHDLVEEYYYTPDYDDTEDVVVDGSDGDLPF